MRESNPPAERPDDTPVKLEISADCFEGEFAEDMPVRMRLAMRASRTARLGASTECFVNDGLDGARTPATLGAAAETTINLFGIARKIFSDAYGVADIVIANDVAGTNNHEKRGAHQWLQNHRYLRLLQDAKGKSIF
jgi:hypothetical protein